MATEIVWFKRDLRVRDHAPLARAAARGAVVPLYVFEPEWLAAVDFHRSHAAFALDGLVDLDRALRARGGALIVRVGSLPEVLDDLVRETGAGVVRAHEETGSGWTYARDRAVRRWARARGVRFEETPSDTVVRGLRDRNGWARRADRRLHAAEIPAPDRVRLPAGLVADGVPDLACLGLAPGGDRDVQRGGETRALDTLASFLAGRGVDYRAAMSSPVTAWDGCSRLSPYLAHGNVSVRTVHHALTARRLALREDRAAGRDVDPRWHRSLSSFASRLRWRGHFMQKLESEPDLEFRNLSRAFDGLREDAFDPDRFAAWRDGRTGYPMVDACMRALAATGWINFRMRAMLTSFAAYHLWLHWRPVGEELARRFVDYEPGIHWSQVQMQSGTTGINAVRIYSPAKQVRDQDPRGTFVRRFVPELEGVPTEYLAEPHRMPPLVQVAAGCRIGRDYPAPIVDPAAAYRAARERMHAVRRTDFAREEAERVYLRHGSRRRPRRRGRATMTA